MEDFPQFPELPQHVRPIVILGAGGIVRDAHLPAYRIAGFHVHSLYDLQLDRAIALAGEFGIPNVPVSLEEAVAGAPENAVFDVAVPASAILDVLRFLPDSSDVLIQKPMGEDLAQSKAILDYCEAHGLTAAINFQMRYVPYVRLAREAIDRGLIGELHDIEVRLTVDTPWHLWTFLNDIPRMEILYHGVHYIDVIRSFCGEPSGVYAKTMGHPRMPRIRQARSTIAMDYGERYRATITANHGHNYGPPAPGELHQVGRNEGSDQGDDRVAPRLSARQTGHFEIFTEETGEWRSIPLHGSWFPHAFIGPMASLMRFAEGSDTEMPTSVQDAYKTMAVVEAAYASSAGGSTPIPELL